MKKMLAIALLSFCLPLLALAGPKIQVPETHWDYGIVPQNATLTHAYWIRNTGDDTLRIIDVKPG